MNMYLMRRNVHALVSMTGSVIEESICKLLKCIKFICNTTCNVLVNILQLMIYRNAIPHTIKLFYHKEKDPLSIE